ncbi:MAG: VWA domain-containing protein [Promethearchaeota archaeon]
MSDYTVQCRIWASNEYYGYGLTIENNSGSAVEFRVSISETIFHESYSYTLIVPDGMGVSRDPFSVYPANVYGTDTVLITVSLEATGEIIHTCTYTHNRIGPTGVILVIDRSGSMSQQNKMQFAKTAAEAFIDSIKPSFIALVDGVYQQYHNKFGVITYNQSASILDITPIVPGLIDFEIPGDHINPYVVTSIQAIDPNGTTSIGAGLRSALDIIREQAFNMRRVILVLSNGKENTAPWITEVVDDLISEVVKVYCIGFGYDYQIDGERLSNLSNQTNGLYRHVEDSDHLTKFFMEVLAEAFDMDVLMDPTDTIIAGETKEYPLQVTSIDEELIFILSWRDPNHELDLEFITPSGEITSSYLPQGSRFVYRDLAYKIYFFNISSNETSFSPPGNWTIRVKAKNDETFNVVALTRSQISFLANLPRRAFINQIIDISAILVINKVPVQDAEIELFVSKPSEAFDDRIAREKISWKQLGKLRYRDGTRTLKERKAIAVYNNKPIKREIERFEMKREKNEESKQITYTCQMKGEYPGNYNLKFHAKWKNDKGEVINRELNRSLYMKTKPSEFPEFKISTLEKSKESRLMSIKIDIAPKDLNGKYIGLGLANELEIITPSGNPCGFKDLGNGWYSVTTQIPIEINQLYIRFREQLWNISLE